MERAAPSPRRWPAPRRREGPVTRGAELLRRRAREAIEAVRAWSAARVALPDARGTAALRRGERRRQLPRERAPAGLPALRRARRAGALRAAGRAARAAGPASRRGPARRLQPGARRRTAARLSPTPRAWRGVVLVTGEEPASGSGARPRPRAAREARRPPACALPRRPSRACCCASIGPLLGSLAAIELARALGRARGAGRALADTRRRRPRRGARRGRRARARAARRAAGRPARRRPRAPRRRRPRRRRRRPRAQAPRGAARAAASGLGSPRLRPRRLPAALRGAARRSSPSRAGRARGGAPRRPRRGDARPRAPPRAAPARAAPSPYALLEHDVMLNELLLAAARGAGRRPGALARAGARRTALRLEAPPAGSGGSPTPAPRELARLVWPELEALLARGADTAVVPLGSTEQHGPHLPFATDTWLADALAERFCARVPEAVRLPALPFGCASEHLVLPGHAPPARRDPRRAARGSGRVPRAPRLRATCSSSPPTAATARCCAAPRRASRARRRARG